MQQKSKLSFGPGAASIILIVVILSMSILNLLSYMMTRNDLSLTERSAEVTEQVYELYAQSERSLAELDALSARVQSETDSSKDYLAGMAEELPSGMTLEGDVVTWVCGEGTHTLNCAASLPVDQEDGHVVWQKHRMVVEMEMNSPWS